MEEIDPDHYVEARFRVSLRYACVASRAWSDVLSTVWDVLRLVKKFMFPNGYSIPWDRAVWRVQLANAIMDPDHVPSPDPVYDISDNENC